jgi:hypothetical protein
MKCQKNGKTGIKWGPSGACYTGPGAKEKALRQMRAEKANSEEQSKTILMQTNDIINAQISAKNTENKSQERQDE